MAQITWNGGAGDDNFLTAANWDGGVVPGPSDDAVILTAVTVQANGSESVNSLTTGANTVVDITGGFTIAGAATGADPTGMSTNAGTIEISDNSTLLFDGLLAGTGTVALESTGDETNFLVGGTGAVLRSGGTLLLGDAANNRVYGQSGSNVLSNDGVIAGSGQLGVGQLTFENGGLVDATGTNSALVLNAATGNTGTLEASGTAGLTIQSTVTDAGGTIEAVGSGVAVNLQSADLVGGTLTTSKGGVIDSDSGYTNTLDGSVGAVTNAGSVVVQDNSTLGIIGTIDNTGTIALESSGDLTDLQVASAAATLTGGGVVLLGGASGNDRIYGASGNDVLINVDNTIEGFGQLGVGQLYLTNMSVVDATDSATALTLDTDTTNTGILEATGTAGLTIQSTITNSGGTIEAIGSGVAVNLQNADVIGGLLTTSKGVIASDASTTNTLDGSTDGAIKNAGSLVLQDDTTLNILGTIDNTGTISLETAGNFTDLQVSGTSAALTGGGTVVLGGTGSNDRILGASGNDLLVNVDNTIEGFGQLGSGQLIFSNDSVVDASDGTTALTLNTNTTNTGLLEATGVAGLTIESSVTNSGTIEAIGSGVPVNLQNAVLVGGVLTTSRGGVIYNDSGHSSSLDGSTDGAITNAGSLVLQDDSALYLFGTIDNTGTIALATTGSDTDLVVGSATATLTGSGTVVLDGASNTDRIFGVSGNDVLVNDETIEGFGQLGVGQLVFDNQSVVDATDSATALVLNAATTNTGTLEATGTAGLTILSTALTNLGGTIEAVGAGVPVNLRNADLVGGLLTTSKGGVIYSDSGYSNTMDGSTDGAITNAGSLVLQDNSALYVLGTIDNTGTISLATTGDDTDLVVGSSAATLTGSGTVVLGGGGGNDRIFGASGGDLLVNVNNTIEGFGQLGVGQLVFDNQSVVDATDSATALMLNAATTNTGALEATGTAGLTIQSTVTNTGGTVEAVGAGVPVNLQNADLIGGTLTTSKGGVIYSDSGYSNRLDGSTDGTITNAGSLVLQDNSALYVFGTIDNTGTISLATTGDDTDLVMGSGTVTLAGGGTVVLGGTSGNDRILGASGNDLLVNDETIEGSGQIGVGQLVLANDGTIVADGYLDLNATLQTAGSLVIAGTSSVLEINPADTDGEVRFAGPDGTLQLDAPNSFAATIAGFAQGDVITLEGDDATSAMLEGTTLAITLSGGMMLDYTLAAAIPGATAFVVPVGGGTDVEIMGGAPCFCAGTRIRTVRGEVRVEALVVGDEVITQLDGTPKKVVWLGRRRVFGTGDRDRALVDPVRVRAGAFGTVPVRDLLLSPDHAVFFEGVLVPVHLLIDGETIVQERHETVVYHHVELERHDVLLAEGLPAESYLDTGNRGKFGNAGLVQLHPTFRADGVGDLCAPMVLDGERLEAVRRARLAVARRLKRRVRVARRA